MVQLVFVSTVAADASGGIEIYLLLSDLLYLTLVQPANIVTPPFNTRCDQYNLIYLFLYLFFIYGCGYEDFSTY